MMNMPNIVRGMLASIALAGLCCTPAIAQGLPPEMPVSKGDLMVRKAGGLLVDVRTPQEWRETGVPVTAHTVSLEDPDFLSTIERLTKGDKDRKIALICRSGNRSAKARDQLLAAGYTNVTSIAGGVTGTEGWIDADLPVRPYND